MAVASFNGFRSLLRYHGRVVEDEAKGAVFFNWTCSGFTVRFSGKTLKARLCAYSSKPPMEPDGADEHPWIGVVGEDGEALLNRLECWGKGASYELFSAEESGVHTVRVVKLSECAKGKVGLLALETDGEFLPPETEGHKLSIEFIGDSITCGFGNEGADRDSPFLTSEENGWRAYDALAARKLNANFNVISVSGISASNPKMPLFPIKQMDEIYEYTDYFYDELTGKKPATWDFAAHKTDVVVVNLGTNDVNPVRFYSELNAADEEELHFYNQYKEFIKLLRRRNGSSALICCTLGPMDYYLYDVISQAVADYRGESGDENICCFKLIGINLLTEGFGALAHPSALTHARLGEELAARLSHLLNERGNLNAKEGV